MTEEERDLKYEEGDRVILLDVVLKNDAGPPRAEIGEIGEITGFYNDPQYPYKVKFQGMKQPDVIAEEEIGRIGDICEKHDDVVYSDKREMWICPFCDIDD